MELLNGTDIRLACPEAIFGLLEPKRGILASGGTTARLPRQIAWPAAMEFLLTAEPVPATRALELGLLNEIVPRHQLLDARPRLGRAHHRERAARGRRHQGERAARAGCRILDEALRIEARLSRQVLDTNDAREGPRAFAEKRAPAGPDLTTV